MEIGCGDVDRLLKTDDPAARAALEAHAGACPACRERLTRWRNISAAAAPLHREWDSPQLWPKIRRALEAEAAGSSRHGRVFGGFLMSLSENWRMAAAVAFLFLLSTSSAVFLVRNYAGRNTVDTTADARLLTDQALREIEVSEAAYAQSISKLARLVEPSIAAPATPLLASYREKLILIDAAIAECRAAIEQNPYNTHVRTELLAMYREKQQTLQDLMKENVHELR
jgi:hypothetical protein